MIFVIMGANVSYAQSKSGINPDKNMPLEITAQKTLEWHRDKKQYIARGDVIATQGFTSIYSNILTADYKENRKGKVDIWRLTASDNVKISSKDTTAYGDRLTYNIDRSLALLTGDNLKLITKSQTITSEEVMEYWINDGVFTAKGNAIAIRGDDKIQADTLKAILEQDKNGKNSIKSMEAINNVIITSPTETITGDKASFLAKENIATLTGNVKIVRGKNILEGSKAIVDLNTNISKIFGNSSSKGRVRGVFYPSSNSK